MYYYCITYRIDRQAKWTSTSTIQWALPGSLRWHEHILLDAWAGCTNDVSFVDEEWASTSASTTGSPGSSESNTSDSDETMMMIFSS